MVVWDRRSVSVLQALDDRDLASLRVPFFGMDVDVDAIPRREPEMAPLEVMTSESQERMLAIVTPEALERVVAVCARWEVRTAGVGHVRRHG